MPQPLLLELDLTRPMLEIEPDDPIDKLRSRGKPRIRPLLQTLYDAADDPRVVGLVAKVGTGALPLATVQELRAGVQAFAASGKPTVAWAETFGESSPGSGHYYLATAFPEIWLQQSGELNLIGVAAEVQFTRGLTDKLGLEPQFGQRYEYKNAADRMLQKEFTPAHREAMERLTASAWEQIVDGVATGRSLTPDEVRALADEAPLHAEAARAARLVDHIGYRDEVFTEVRRRVGGDVQLLFADRWRKKQSPATRIAHQVKAKKSPGVALVNGYGGVMLGKSRRSPLMGQVMGSDTISAALRAAVRDERTRAVVFRVDSPGGSYVASDTIWREVTCARAAGKPVVVSMGAVAGSGGYFVACPADVIVASPGTLTGSIGVFGGKMVVDGLTDKIGLSYDTVQHGAHARMYSAHEKFSESELARLDEFLDRVYADFTGKVASGRGMTQDAVHAIAKGRVWTGADAAGIGLVDTLGGLRDAVRIAREKAGLPADAPVRPAGVVPPLARLKPAKSSDDPRAAAAVTAWSSGWGEFAAIAQQLGLSSYGPLTMPGLTLR